jgi:hypothetical protein
MSKKLISVEEFRAKLRDGAAPTDAGVQRLATGDVAEVSGKDRTLRFCFSDESIDRSGDKIEQNGWDLKNFLANPCRALGSQLFRTAHWPCERCRRCGCQTHGRHHLRHCR